MSPTCSPPTTGDCSPATACRTFLREATSSWGTTAITATTVAPGGLFRGRFCPAASSSSGSPSTGPTACAPAGSASGRSDRRRYLRRSIAPRRQFPQPPHRHRAHLVLLHAVLAARWHREVAGHRHAGVHGGVAAFRHARGFRHRSSLSSAGNGFNKNKTPALARCSRPDVHADDGDELLGAPVPAAHGHGVHLLHCPYHH